MIKSKVKRTRSALTSFCWSLTLGCSGILARPQRKGIADREEEGERDRQRREVDLSIAGFSAVVCGEMGVLMHRDKPDRAPLCVLHTDKPIQSQTTHLDIFLFDLFDFI